MHHLPSNCEAVPFANLMVGVFFSVDDKARKFCKNKMLSLQIINLLQLESVLTATMNSRVSSLK